MNESSFFTSFIKDEQLLQYGEGLEGAVLAVFIQSAFAKTKGSVWVIVSTEEDARGLIKDLRFLGTEVIQIESTGFTLYSEPDDEAALKRLKTFSEIADNGNSVIVSSLRGFSTAVPTREQIEQSRISLRIGDDLDPIQLAELLAENGYLRCAATTMPGEFSIRGEVIDLFPFESENPVRFYLDWERVEKISVYDTITQDTFRKMDHFAFLLSTSAGREPPESVSFAESYIEDNDILILFGDQRLGASYESLTLEAKKKFREVYLENRAAPRPQEILFDYTSLFKRKGKTLVLDDIRGQHTGALSIDFVGPRSYFGNFTYLRDELNALEQDGYDITIFAGSKSQEQRLSLILKEHELAIVPDEISGGFSIPEKKIIALCDHEIFGRRKQAVKALHHTNISPLDTFVELEPDDYVVHVNYGIGIFRKIDRIKALGKERDYIQIEYAGQEQVFIPIEQANLIQRYIGKDGSKPRLDKIGGTTWERKKNKAKKNAEDLAERLIRLYARRKQAHGTALQKDTDWQLQFEAMFPYEETDDQITCMQDIKEDMEKPIVMDRLVCGDVGYGKTELAIRAAFKAVMSGKQVTFLAPTTILAEQHYDTIIDRVDPFPMRVAMLSRLVDKKEQRAVLKRLQNGEIDILVGTHRVIQKDVLYRDLGLLIVDEEQRFGVKDKEKIKEMKASVDSLALSATPIPRTLYMSLLKIRDMSLLTTPPMQRIAIKTVIKEYDDRIVHDAIRNEIERGGQVFYLHNRVETLDQVVSILKKILPDVSIDFAHGQMNSELLEEKMRLFVHNGFQVLVATTIIENGIDIPNVNTIIIDRADRYGVSQLYQLRGRVGRSDRVAYAYLLYPNQRALTEVAMKRLKILSEHTDLGSGFKIAMKDMEMRGTGNLLGREQSGQMQAVGLDMYLRILDEEISRIAKSEKISERDVFLDLDYSGYIPESYIDEPSTKFEIYRKISGITDELQIKKLNSELEDRFGPIPQDVENLIYIAELKVLCRRLEVYFLKEFKGTVRVEFSKIASISVQRLIDLIRESNGAVSIDQKKPNIVMMKTDAVSLKDKSLFMLEKLQRLLQ